MDQILSIAVFNELLWNFEVKCNCQYLLESDTAKDTKRKISANDPLDQLNSQASTAFFLVNIYLNYLSDGGPAKWLKTKPICDPSAVTISFYIYYILYLLNINLNINIYLYKNINLLNIYI